MLGQLTDPALGRTPISEAQPAGTDMTHDPRYEELMAEVNRAVAVESEGPADWEKIVGLSTELLERSTKDLRVAGALALALTRTRKEDGFLMGSEICLDILDAYWETLFPPLSRPLARSRALDWWINRSLAALPTDAHFPQDRADPFRRRFEKTGQHLRNALPETPSFAPILEKLSVVPAEPSQPNAPASSPAVAAKPVSTLIDSPASAQTQITQAQEIIRRVITYFSSQDLTDPRLYRWNRQSLWLNVHQLPPQTGSRTLLAPPPDTLRARLQTLRTSGNPEPLLNAAESETSQHIFWLDLHRFVWEALNALGEKFQPAAEAVRGETAHFLARLPDLLELGFSNGVPFADSDTRQWIEGGRGKETPQPPTPAEQDTNQKDLDRLKKLFARGAVIEGARLFEERARACPSPREKLVWRAACVKAMTPRAPTAFLSAQVDRLLGEIDGYRVAEFDPPLALDIVVTSFRACRARREKEFGEKAAHLLSRIATLDLEKFMKEGGTHVQTE